MGQTLTEIAQTLRDTDKKVQLIYAFNGVGKTRLSSEFKELIAPKVAGEAEDEVNKKVKVLYYNAFTEDLFYWDNDLYEDRNRKLIIHPNDFTGLLFKFLTDQGLDGNIASQFQHYTNSSITPEFNNEFSEVTFSIKRGGDDSIENIKISKGEESNFIWCIFYSLIEQVVDILNITELENRSTDQFNQLEYIFIDDPVTSLDDNHLIELAVDLAGLIRRSDYQFNKLKFIITTHNPLFYNVLCNRLSGAAKIILEKMDDGTFEIKQTNDSPFSYHLFLLAELEKAIQTNEIKKYHYNFLRQLFEKTATFLGYQDWKDLLPDDARKAYYDLIISFRSHAKHSAEETIFVDDNEKRVMRFLVNYIKTECHFRK